jgi:hypothetical protein
MYVVPNPRIVKPFCENIIFPQQPTLHLVGWFSSQTALKGTVYPVATDIHGRGFFAF